MPMAQAPGGGAVERENVLKRGENGYGMGDAQPSA